MSFLIVVTVSDGRCSNSEDAVLYILYLRFITIKIYINSIFKYLDLTLLSKGMLDLTLSRWWIWELPSDFTDTNNKPHNLLSKFFSIYKYYIIRTQVIA